MSKIEVNQISSQCGSTLTVGQSGDTVTLAAGATQTGFGRTGTVDWDTTAKTASFTAVSGNGYFVNTTSGAITLTLPASPSAGDIVGLKDYAGTFATNNLTIGRNGSPINGGNGIDPVIQAEGASLFLVYVDGTRGWLATQDDASTLSGESYIVATGGTITTCGDCKIHTFTGPGTFTVCSISSSSANNQVSYVVVAGGGAGSSGAGGGGGGAGGFREDKSPVTPYTASPLEGAGPITVTATTFPITVGGGGTASPNLGGPGGGGSNSVFSTITSAGGGGTGSFKENGLPGGSGGGGSSRDDACGPQIGGTGNTPPVSPPQGNSGGNAEAPNGAGTNDAGGGGGGAGGAGRVGNVTCDPQGGPGGPGATTSITGTPTIYAGGGGGGRCANAASGLGGPGGGGKGGSPNNTSVAGTANTGGGGGGAREECTSNGGSNGGSGIVIIRYKYQ